MTYSYKTIVPFITTLFLLAMGLLVTSTNLADTLSIYKLMTEIAYFTIVIALVISYWFNSFRVFFISLILLLSQVALSLPHSEAGTFSANYFALLTLMAPLNILFISLLKDGAVLSSRGKLVIGVFLGQGLLLLSLLLTPNEFVPSVINFEIILIKLLVTPIPDLAILLFALTIVILATKLRVGFSTVHAYLLGVLFAISFAYHYYGENGAEAFIFIAGILLIIIVIFRSYSMAYLDELTQLPSRRMLDIDLLKLGSKYALAMLDIDHFKKFNDTYGHDIGDEVLKLVASSLEKVSGGGKAYRYGGEEFTILFPKKDVKDVLPHLEQLRNLVAKKGFPYQKVGQATPRNLHVTISIGVAERNEQDRKPEDVLKAADQALYRAKRKGRNCISK